MKDESSFKTANKSDDSNRKRLESLKQQAEEFKLKKSLIKNSLNSLVKIILNAIIQSSFETLLVFRTSLFSWVEKFRSIAFLKD